MNMKSLLMAAGVAAAVVIAYDRGYIPMTSLYAKRTGG